MSFGYRAKDVRQSKHSDVKVNECPNQLLRENWVVRVLQNEA